MAFTDGFSIITAVFKSFRYLFFTAIHVWVIRWVTERPQTAGDSDWLADLIVICALLFSIAFLIDSMRATRKQWHWVSVLYLAFCVFNVYYIFKMLLCCLPLAGDLNRLI